MKPRETDDGPSNSGHNAQKLATTPQTDVRTPRPGPKSKTKVIEGPAVEVQKPSVGEGDKTPADKPVPRAGPKSKTKLITSPPVAVPKSSADDRASKVENLNTAQKSDPPTSPPKKEAPTPRAGPKSKTKVIVTPKADVNKLLGAGFDPASSDEEGEAPIQKPIPPSTEKEAPKSRAGPKSKTEAVATPPPNVQKLLGFDAASSDEDETPVQARSSPAVGTKFESLERVLNLKLNQVRCLH